MSGGMKEDRSCTDILCCLIFLVFIVAMVGCSGYAIHNGDPERILTPFDSDGNACGQPDQCSNDDYAMPQGTACPTAPVNSDGLIPYKVPAVDADGNPSTDSMAGKTVYIPPPRDFSEYKYKYFPLTNKLSFWTAVCVKECPGTLYTAKV